jgi:20S proteasome alpha/beta subunit
MHLFTAYGQARPFGSSIILAGLDQETKKHELYMAEPTGEVFVRARVCARACGTATAVSPPKECVAPPRTLTVVLCCCGGLQRYFGCASGKGTRSAKTEIEKMKLSEKTCREALGPLAKMYAVASCIALPIPCSSFSVAVPV